MLQRGTTKWHCVNDENLNQFACEKQQSAFSGRNKIWNECDLFRAKKNDSVRPEIEWIVKLKRTRDIHGNYHLMALLYSLFTHMDMKWHDILFQVPTKNNPKIEKAIRFRCEHFSLGFWVWFLFLLARLTRKWTAILQTIKWNEQALHVPKFKLKT